MTEEKKEVFLKDGTKLSHAEAEQAYVGLLDLQNMNKSALNRLVAGVIDEIDVEVLGSCGLLEDGDITPAVRSLLINCIEKVENEVFIHSPFPPRPTKPVQPPK